MSNEIVFGWQPDIATLVANVYQNVTAGTVREADIGCTEAPASSGFYHADCATIVIGDYLIIDDGTDNVLHGFYDPERVATVKAIVDSLQDLIEADKVIDIAQSPWELVIKHKDTGTELLRKTMKTPQSASITNILNVLGRLEKP